MNHEQQPSSMLAQPRRSARTKDPAYRAKYLPFRRAIKALKSLSMQKRSERRTPPELHAAKSTLHTMYRKALFTIIVNSEHGEVTHLLLMLEFSDSRTSTIMPYWQLHDVAMMCLSARRWLSSAAKVVLSSLKIRRTSFVVDVSCLLSKLLKHLEGTC